MENVRVTPYIREMLINTNHAKRSCPSPNTIVVGASRMPNINIFDSIAHSINTIIK